MPSSSPNVDRAAGAETEHLSRPGAGQPEVGADGARSR